MTPQPLLINMLSCKTNRYEWLHAADVKATRFCAPRMLSVNNRERARPCSVLCLVRDTSWHVTCDAEHDGGNITLHHTTRDGNADYNCNGDIVIQKLQHDDMPLHIIEQNYIYVCDNVYCITYTGYFLLLCRNGGSIIRSIDPNIHFYQIQS